MKKTIIAGAAGPALVYASGSESLTASFFSAWAPILLLFFILWLVIRLIFGQTSRANDRLVDANERIASSLEEIAMLLRKKQ